MNRSIIIWSLILIISGIILGAFGAHSLKEIISQDKLLSFETGIRYQIYQGLGMLIIGFSSEKIKFSIKWFILLFIVIWIFPNTNQISIYLESSSFKRGSTSIYKYNLDHSYIYLVIISFFLFIASFPGNQLNQPFIYFQF